MAKLSRQRVKHCDKCKQTNEIMFRVMTDNLTRWVIVCPSCQNSLKDNEGYRYGGTWKSVKRH